jgi:pimeloyl-ACP methyl ester carboxylesterase
MSKLKRPPVETVELRGTDGLRLVADAAGDPDGTPVVLLHGAGQTRHAWRTTLSAVADDGWRAYSVDLRGHGESEWARDGDYSHSAFAGDVRELALSFGRPAVLVGASLGGIASLLAITDHPDEQLALALVLVDITPGFSTEGAHRIVNFMNDRLDDGFASLSEVADALQRFNPHRERTEDLSGLHKNLRERPDGRLTWHWDPQYMTGQLSTIHTEGHLMAEQQRFATAARSLALPTLLVRGQRSDLITEESAHAFLRLVPHARYVDVEGAGHMVVGDRNDSFNTAIVTFLASLPH